MKRIQKEVDEMISSYKVGYFKPLEILTRLVEEVGETARELNHLYGPKKKKASEETQELGDEMADIIYTLACLANSLNIDLDKHFDRIMNKYKERDKDRWEKR
ncbi:MAG: nucleotide pyrophosphohydrolase [Candidatus Shapirobacteria bacterium]|jgi:NTP pyrophosphatase (non-canonical NTP hydrolase)|nr:nucleotide pyrophosphohydrolase [Candidatus Shapirobacteria bacterium]